MCTYGAPGFHSDTTSLVPIDALQKKSLLVSSYHYHTRPL